MGDRNAILAREMTKLHEEFIRGSVSEILKTLESRAEIKGECTLLVAGFEGKEALNAEEIMAEIKSALDKQQSGLSEIAKSIAQKYGLSKNKVYDLALKVRGQRSENRSQRTEVREQKK
jgi:16S rRNA (cytidine1402-2'-O)-methyltransferase